MAPAVGIEPTSRMSYLVINCHKVSYFSCQQLVSKCQKKPYRQFYYRRKFVSRFTSQMCIWRSIGSLSCFWFDLGAFCTLYNYILSYPERILSLKLKKLPEKNRSYIKLFSKMSVLTFGWFLYWVFACYGFGCFK